MREAFWNHFRALAGAGATLLVSTHQMDEVLHCDRIAVMHDGRLLFCDAPGRLRRLGRTQIRIWRGSQFETTTVDDYAEQLPALLKKYNLDPEVSRIEIEDDPLERIVLRLVTAGEAHRFAPQQAAHVDHV